MIKRWGALVTVQINKIRWMNPVTKSWPRDQCIVNPTITELHNTNTGQVLLKNYQDCPQIRSAANTFSKKDLQAKENDFFWLNSVKVWANTILTESSPELSVTSQWTHKMSSRCNLAVSFPWVCNSHSELTATTAWWAHGDDLTNSSQQAHSVSCKLMEGS